MDKWKFIAMLFIILFVIENLILLFAFQSINREQQNANLCEYRICEGYFDYEFSDGVCYCYEYNNVGELGIYKEELVEFWKEKNK